LCVVDDRVFVLRGEAEIGHQLRKALLQRVSPYQFV
jgi:hypothetical protein